MARDFIPRSRAWLRWASGLLLVAAGCVQAMATAIAAPQIPAGEARIWFYRGDEPMSGSSGTAIPTIAANGTYVGSAEPGTVFYRDVSAGHYHVAVQAAGGHESADFELPAGQQAYVKIVFHRGGTCKPWQHQWGFRAVLVSKQVAQAEVPSLSAEGAQR
jgi:hypothetical protein